MELNNSFELLSIDDEDSSVEQELVEQELVEQELVEQELFQNIPSDYSEGDDDYMNFVRLRRSKLSDDMLYLLDSYKRFTQLRCECCDEPEIKKSIITDIDRNYFGKKITLSKEIEYDREILMKYFDNDKLLLLKPYTGQTKLIFFCGCGEQQHPGYSESDIQEHKHEGYFSVDVDLNMVPHAIGYVGSCTFSFIPSGTITEILFEGGMAKPTELLETEILRLLCEGGVLIDGTAAHQEDKVLAVKEIDRLIFNQYYEDLYDYCTYNPNSDYIEQDNDSEREDSEREDSIRPNSQTNPSWGDEVG